MSVGCSSTAQAPGLHLRPATPVLDERPRPAAWVRRLLLTTLLVLAGWLLCAATAGAAQADGQGITCTITSGSVVSQQTDGGHGTSPSADGARLMGRCENAEPDDSGPPVTGPADARPPATAAATEPPPAAAGAPVSVGDVPPVVTDQVPDPPTPPLPDPTGHSLPDQATPGGPVDVPQPDVPQPAVPQPDVPRPDVPQPAVPQPDVPGPAVPAVPDAVVPDVVPEPVGSEPVVSEPVGSEAVGSEAVVNQAVVAPLPAAAPVVPPVPASDDGSDAPDVTVAAPAAAAAAPAAVPVGASLCVSPDIGLELLPAAPSASGVRPVTGGGATFVDVPTAGRAGTATPAPAGRDHAPSSPLTPLDLPLPVPAPPCPSTGSSASTSGCGAGQHQYLDCGYVVVLDTRFAASFTTGAVRPTSGFPGDVVGGADDPGTRPG